MKCVLREEVKDILEEIHKGVCGNHASSRTLVNKAFRRAFYWPTPMGDAEELVRRCQGCQYFTMQQHVPAYKLVTIPMLTDKRCIHLRSASIRTYTFFTTGFPRFLSIRGARGLQAFDLPLLTNYSNPNYD
jgi:hypothetical protein